MIYKINKQNQTKHWIDLSPIYIHCLILKLKINIRRKNTEQDIPGAPAGERDTTKQKQKVLESEDGHSSQRWQKYLYKVSINYDILYTVRQKIYDISKEQVKRQYWQRFVTGYFDKIK